VIVDVPDTAFFQSVVPILRALMLAGECKNGTRLMLTRDIEFADNGPAAKRHPNAPKGARSALFMDDGETYRCLTVVHHTTKGGKVKYAALPPNHPPMSDDDEFIWTMAFTAIAKVFP
jgi:hypothetical protein